MIEKPASVVGVVAASGLWLDGFVGIQTSFSRRHRENPWRGMPKMRDECTILKDEILNSSRKFTIAEAKAIIDRICDYTIDTDDRFHNTFFHEICPLFLIAERVGFATTRIAFMGSDSRFDGLLLLDDGRNQKIELTAAIDGYHDALRMELLAERGRTPAFQPIQASGTKGNRIFGPNETVVVCADEYDQRTLLPLLEKSLAYKIRKARINHSYSGAWLGVIFNDWVCPRGWAEKKERFDPLCQRLLEGGSERYAPFARVFVIGISRKYLFDSREA